MSTQFSSLHLSSLGEV